MGCGQDSRYHGHLVEHLALALLVGNVGVCQAFWAGWVGVQLGPTRLRWLYYGFLSECFLHSHIKAIIFYPYESLSNELRPTPEL